MNLYTDTSALVKRYIWESGSDEVIACFGRFETAATAALSQVEMAAALAKAVRQGWVDETDASEAWLDFLSHWSAYVRLPLSGSTLERAARLAWKHGLRAYDAVHLACAQIWQESTGEATLFACFDQRLRQAATAEGLQIWPELET